MQRIREREASGLNKNKLRTLGMLCLAIGIVGRGVIQNGLLGLNDLTTQELLAVMDSRPEMMTYATIALIMQAFETFAVPIFAFMLVDGFRRTCSFTKYLTRLAILAVASELPYNLAMSGKWLDFSTRNPAFALVLGLITLHFMDRYAGKDLKNILIRIAVAIAALVWSSMLKIQEGGCILLIVLALSLFRNKPTIQNLFGAAAAMVCCLASPFYMVSPMAFMAIHFYNGEQREENRTVNYLIYPLVLLAAGIVSVYVL